jgi:hypothetical protein
MGMKEGVPIIPVLMRFPKRKDSIGVTSFA